MAKLQIKYGFFIKPNKILSLADIAVTYNRDMTK